MLLSDGDIQKAQKAGRFAIEPFHEDMVQPASIDVRLHTHFLVFENHRQPAIDPSRPNEELTTVVSVPEGMPFVLHPGEFALASSWEKIKLGPDLAARLEGKSSLGRLGLMVHSTAGFIDPGFEGTVTLELSNVANLPINLWPGMRIGQLSLFMLSSPAKMPYGTGQLGSHYQGQLGPAASRSHERFDVADVYR